jgi:hypothetical protein
MEIIMRPRRSFFEAVLLVLIWTGAGCRNSGIISATTAIAATQSPAETPITLPNKDGSLKFAVLGDFGTGEQPQYQLAEQMTILHGRFKYDFVVTVGDNLYGSERPQDFYPKSGS